MNRTKSNTKKFEEELQKNKMKFYERKRNILFKGTDSG